MSNIAVYDGAATPVLHTLVPVSITRESGKATAIYREQVSSLPINAQVSATISLVKAKSGVYKAEARTVVPVMETVSGQNAAGYTAAPKVAYEDTVILTGFFHERSSIAGRRLVRQLALNIGGNVTTSVAAVVTGPFAELFDQLVMPN
jgi:hypothetical protein